MDRWYSVFVWSVRTSPVPPFCIQQQLRENTSFTRPLPLPARMLRRTFGCICTRQNSGRLLMINGRGWHPRCARARTCKKTLTFQLLNAFANKGVFAFKSSELNLVQWITIRYAKGMILLERYFQRCMVVRAALMPLAPTFAGTCWRDSNSIDITVHICEHKYAYTSSDQYAVPTQSIPNCIGFYS